jgi:uncharacterized damage-inducible protein DinB
VESHDVRIARVGDAYREAHARFVTRVRGAGVLAERVPPGGGWSVAQIAWHVATVDGTFAAIMAGERPSLVLPPDFRERSWREIAAGIPDRLEATGPSVPPEVMRVTDALAALERSSAQIEAALGVLTPVRGSRQGITHRIVGTISLYQVGEWAVAHTIRHNAQAKRVLSSLAPSPSGGV